MIRSPPLAFPAAFFLAAILISFLQLSLLLCSASVFRALSFGSRVTRSVEPPAFVAAGAYARCSAVTIAKPPIPGLRRPFPGRPLRGPRARVRLISARDGDD